MLSAIAPNWKRQRGTKRRRRYLSRESQFYGAMDGAMKFVKRTFAFASFPCVIALRESREKQGGFGEGRCWDVTVGVEGVTGCFSSASCPPSSALKRTSSR